MFPWAQWPQQSVILKKFRNAKTPPTAGCLTKLMLFLRLPCLAPLHWIVVCFPYWYGSFGQIWTQQPNRNPLLHVVSVHSQKNIYIYIQRHSREVSSFVYFLIPFNQWADKTIFLWFLVMHFYSLGFFYVWKETEPRRKQTKFINWSNWSDQSKWTIAVLEEPWHETVDAVSVSVSEPLHP